MIYRYIVISICLIGILSPWVRAESLVPPIPAYTTETKPPDYWLGLDKYWHFGVSLAMTCGMFYGCRQIALVDEDLCLVLAPTWTLIAGIAKEDYDLKKKKTYISKKDLVVDVLGIGVGMAIIMLTK